MESEYQALAKKHNIPLKELEDHLAQIVLDYDLWESQMYFNEDDSFDVRDDEGKIYHFSYLTGERLDQEETNSEEGEEKEENNLDLEKWVQAYGMDPEDLNNRLIKIAIKFNVPLAKIEVEAQKVVRLNSDSKTLLVSIESLEIIETEKSEKESEMTGNPTIHSDSDLADAGDQGDETLAKEDEEEEEDQELSQESDNQSERETDDSNQDSNLGSSLASDSDVPISE